MFRHLKKGTLRWMVHHGSKRISNVIEISQYDIVLTSYHTITSEWKKRERTASPILLHKWHRLALDEGKRLPSPPSSSNRRLGHQIRNSHTIAAKALCSLQSRSRWIVTGTPIQNRLSDLTSLLQFLRAHPYDDATTFEAHIVEPWKRGNEEVAIQRLKKLFTALALRRSKSVVELPARLNVKRTLDFTAGEIAQYREAEASISTVLDGAIRSGRCTAGLYANALQRINRLRMICNLGAFVKYAKEEREILLSEDLWNAGIAQEYLNDLITVGVAVCADCGVDLESLGQDESELSPDKGGEGRLFKCMLLLCNTCFHTRQKKRRSRCTSCGGSPPCPGAAVVASCSFSNPPQYAAQQPTDVFEFPTKITTLIEDVESLPKTTKRYRCPSLFNEAAPNAFSVVFSFWTSTLDIVELALSKTSIRHARVDGKMQMKRRMSEFEKFRDDGNVKVLLLSLSCGALG